MEIKNNSNKTKKEIIINGRLYQVIGHPTIIQDQYALVQIWIAENEHRAGHWRALPYGLKRLNIIDHTQRLISNET